MLRLIAEMCPPGAQFNLARTSRARTTGAAHTPPQWYAASTPVVAEPSRQSRVPTTAEGFVTLCRNPRRAPKRCPHRPDVTSWDADTEHMNAASPEQDHAAPSWNLVWATNRQALCDSLAHFKCHQGGVYNSDNEPLGILLGANLELGDML